MILLGSTGSIGVNALKIAKDFSISIEALVAGTNITLLNQQIQEFAPKVVCVAYKEDISKVNHPNVTYGQEGIERIIENSNSDTVINALVGFAGLRPTMAAIKASKKIALANKESLVVAGKFIDTTHIIPIDSEHFGLWYLANDKKIAKMTITASGGAFRDTPLGEIKSKKLADALKHPNWSMGQKITIDSATMVNKLFEVIEAYWLFDCAHIDAIIETKSIIHALVDFVDGSTTAHIAHADMRLPIAYAMAREVDKEILPSVDLTQIRSLEFRSIDTDRYPIWQIKEMMLQKPHLGVIINAANEAAIAKFIQGDISFGTISKHILESLQRFESFEASSIEDIFAIDHEIRCLNIKEK